MEGLIYARSPSPASAHVRAHAHKRRYGKEKARGRTKHFFVVLYCRRRGRRRPIGGFRGGWRLFVHRCVVTFLFARPLYMAAHTYGYASIYPDWAIKIPTRADTSGIIRSSKQDCPDDSDFRGPPPSFLHPSSVSPSHCYRSRPFLVKRSPCGQSRKPSQPRTYRRSNRLESLLRKNIDEFCLRDITRHGSQSKSCHF